MTKTAAAVAAPNASLEVRQFAELELEALSNKHFSFITQEYLPRKLKDKRWLD